MSDRYFDKYKTDALELMALYHKTRNQRARMAMYWEADRQAKEYADAFVQHCGDALDSYEKMACEDTDSKKMNAIQHLASLIRRGPKSTNAALWAAAVWHVAYSEAMGDEL